VGKANVMPFERGGFKSLLGLGEKKLD